ncbi:hypothetical protein JMUB7522_27510 [Staphylococcus aureus]
MQRSLVGSEMCIRDMLTNTADLIRLIIRDEAVHGLSLIHI